MSFARDTVYDAAVGVAIADDRDDLSAFSKPGCAAAVWRRQIPQHIDSWLDKIAPENLPKTRVILPSHAIVQTLTHVCDMAGLIASKERAWLCYDIASLAETFSSLMSAQFLRIRLDVIDTNACRKFHIDALTARLVCTYRGTGTQYGVSTDGADPTRVFTVQTGCPILLRGTEWPTQPASGLLHRSPPIAGTGETRLVLVLDPVINPDDAT